MNRTFAVAVVALAAVAAGLFLLQRHRPDAYVPPPPTFSGSSTELRSTAVVPTLDSPLSPGKNVVWCSSFEAAWEKLKTTVVKQPIRLSASQTVADRLNAVANVESELPQDGYYVDAGLLKDATISHIRAEMARRFPAVPTPAFDVQDGGPGAVAFAYLQASCTFAIPYFDNHKPLEFVDSHGRKTSVKSFGVRDEDDSGYPELREQTAVLFAEPPEKPGPNARVTDLGEFAVDPDRASKDVQLLLAVVRPKKSLAETWDYTRAKILEYASAVPKARSISLTDTLLVPNINWRLAHRFKELETTSIQNPPLAGLPIVQAGQMVSFRLDRNGAQLSSEAKLAVAAIPTHYAFDRPFLVVMKKRSARRPFFVMWVDNAELLSSMR